MIGPFVELILLMCVASFSSMFIWAQLPGVGVMWPVWLMDPGSDSVYSVYSKSDDAFFNVKKENTLLFSGRSKCEERGSAKLKKKPATLLAFLADVAWAKEGDPGEAVKTLTTEEPKTNTQKLSPTVKIPSDSGDDESGSELEEPKIKKKKVQNHSVSGDKESGSELEEPKTKTMKSSPTVESPSDSVDDKSGSELEETKIKKNKLEKPSGSGDEECGYELEEPKTKTKKSSPTLEDPSDSGDDESNSELEESKTKTMESSPTEEYLSGSGDEESGSELEEPKTKTKKSSPTVENPSGSGDEESGSKLEEPKTKTKKYSPTVEDPSDSGDDESDSELEEPKTKKKKLAHRVETALDTEEGESALEDNDEDEIICDEDNPNIYVRKVLKSFTTAKGGKAKKCDRIYNSRHQCPFCTRFVSNFAQHVTRRHKMETSVKNIVKQDWKKRRLMFAKLRRKSDHEHNVKVLETKSGEIVLGRRFDKGPIHISNYGPCPKCFEWIRISVIPRHQKSCPANHREKHVHQSKSCLLTESDVLSGRISIVASSALVKEVFTIMKSDNISKVAQSDPLIITIGNRWLEKLKGNTINRKYYTSGIMRLAAKLLMQLRQVAVNSLDGPAENALRENTLRDYLRPQHFDQFVKAAFVCSHQDSDDLEDLGSPSNAIKLGYEIKRLVAAKLGFAIRNRDSDEKEECRDFLQLMENEWGVRVTTLARITLNERKFNQEKTLPEPDDLKTLSNYLKRELAELDLEFRPATFDTYRRTCILAEAKLISYNRRRPGEVQAIMLASYAKRIKGVSKLDMQMTRELNVWEKKLLEGQEIVEVRGKTGRGVPVLLPEETNLALTFISDPNVRRSVGICEGNKYLFASRGLGVFRGYDALSTVAQQAELSKPQKITSTNLRKYMATVTQVLDMNRAQLDWVCEHLGHSVDVHMTHYRSRSDILERVEVSKLLLVQDNARVQDFVGQRLQDIQMKDLVFGKSNNVNQEQALGPPHSEFQPVVFNDDADDETVTDDILRHIETDEEYDDSCELPKKKKKLAARGDARHKWTAEEKKELKTLFKSHFDRGKCPNQKDCQDAIKISKTNGGQIHSIKRDNIKKKVSYMLTHNM